MGLALVLTGGGVGATEPAPLAAQIRWTMQGDGSADEDAMRFLALGDSYTIGEAVDPSERWPVRLAALLREAGFNFADPQIIATTGWTTDELSAGIDQTNPQGTFELVSLLIGVNNQYRGREAEEYRRQFVALLQRAVQFAGGAPSRVIVLSIPDWSVSPFAAGRSRAEIAAAIDTFNAINKEEAGRAGAYYVDVTPVSRAAADDPLLIAADGLHPSGKMYTEWARLALPAACAALDGGWGVSIRLDPEEAELKALAAFAAHFDGKRILEVGCGTGRLLWRYADRTTQVVGIDPNAARVARAVADTPARLRDRVRLHAADIETFAATAPGKFDTVILAWSL